MSKITVNQTLLDEINAKAARETFKAGRQALVDAIIVTINGLPFDGDEKSQDRMTRAISVMKDDETTLWVLADNTVVMVPKETLVAALRAAGAAQSALWVMPEASGVMPTASDTPC